MNFMGKFLRKLHTFKSPSVGGAKYFSLMQDKAYVNGQWIGALSEKTFDVINPATEKVLNSVPALNEDDVGIAIQKAHDAFHTWQHTTAKERSMLMKKWYNLMVQNQDEMAKLLTAEQGKPIKEALGEVMYGYSYVEWYAEEARRIHGEVVQSPTNTKEMLFIRRPIGVAAMITPWNFPIAMITRKVAAALACGCTCIVKPAEDTPLSALGLAALADEAGIPPGVFNVITCKLEDIPSVGKLLCESPLIAGISLTGSTEVGKILYKQCANGIKRLSLELGGNAPFIVFTSANLDHALEGAMVSKFRNTGQTCISTNKFLIQEEVYDEFVEKLGEAMKTRLVLGNGFTPEVNQGPLINRDQANKVDLLVQDAVQKGAQVKLGGSRDSLGHLFYQPTLLTDVTSEMNCFHMELFGPVAVCIKFKTEDEAVSIVNSSETGLAGYFYSNDIAQIWRVSKRLEVGMVGINEGLISSVEAAFGGIKQSGQGREGSSHGIDEYTYIKYLCFGNL